MVPQDVVQAVSREPAQPQPEKSTPFSHCHHHQVEGLGQVGWLVGQILCLGLGKWKPAVVTWEDYCISLSQFKTLLSYLLSGLRVSLCLEFFICKIGVNIPHRGNICSKVPWRQTALNAGYESEALPRTDACMGKFTSFS